MGLCVNLVRNALLTGQWAPIHAERQLTVSANSHYVPIAAARATEALKVGYMAYCCRWVASVEERSSANAALGSAVDVWQQCAGYLLLKS